MATPYDWPCLIISHCLIFNLYRKQKSELERKYAEIEARKDAYKSELSEYTLPTSEGEATQGDAEQMEGGYLHTPRKTVKQETYHHRGSAYLLQKPIDTSASSMPVSKGTRFTASRDEEHIKRIKDYQNKLLERQRQKQRLIQERLVKVGVDSRLGMTNGDGQVFLTSDVSVKNQQPSIGEAIPLSAEMANDQYFHLPDTSNMEVPSVPETFGKRLGNNEGHSVTEGIFEANMYPPEQVSDSPNHRVQDWLSYYQQLSSKEQSPVAVSDNNLATRYVASGEAYYLDSLSLASNNIFSGSNADTSNCTIKRKEDADTIVPSANANPERNTQKYEYSRHLLQDTDENKPAEDKNQSDTVEDDTASCHVNDRNACYIETMNNVSSRFEELTLQNEATAVYCERELSAQLNDSSKIGYQPRLVPSYAQTYVAEVHIPHELSTIQELEEQSTRKLSQIQSVSAKNKRLSSSPIKEDTSDVSKTQLHPKKSHMLTPFQCFQRGSIVICSSLLLTALSN